MPLDEWQLSDHWRISAKINIPSYAENVLKTGTSHRSRQACFKFRWKHDEWITKKSLDSTFVWSEELWRYHGELSTSAENILSICIILHNILILIQLLPIINKHETQCFMECFTKTLRSVKIRVTHRRQCVLLSDVKYKGNRFEKCASLIRSVESPFLSLWAQNWPCTFCSVPLSPGFKKAFVKILKDEMMERWRFSTLKFRLRKGSWFLP